MQYPWLSRKVMTKNRDDELVIKLCQNRIYNCNMRINELQKIINKHRRQIENIEIKRRKNKNESIKGKSTTQL